VHAVTAIVIGVLFSFAGSSQAAADGRLEFAFELYGNTARSVGHAMVGMMRRGDLRVVGARGRTLRTVAVDAGCELRGTSRAGYAVLGCYRDRRPTRATRS
jgi:hypothetical protein